MLIFCYSTIEPLAALTVLLAKEKLFQNSLSSKVKCKLYMKSTAEQQKKAGTTENHHFSALFLFIFIIIIAVNSKSMCTKSINGGNLHIENVNQIGQHPIRKTIECVCEINE
jgi:hypothetical protein